MITLIRTVNGAGTYMKNSRNGSTLISVICAFFILCVCSCVFAASFNVLLRIRSRAEKLSENVNKCVAAYYSEMDSDAAVTERSESIAVYDENGNAVFSFDAVVRKAECGDLEIYGFMAVE